MTVLVVRTGAEIWSELSSGSSKKWASIRKQKFVLLCDEKGEGGLLEWLDKEIKETKEGITDYGDGRRSLSKELRLALGVKK